MPDKLEIRRRFLFATISLVAYIVLKLAIPNIRVPSSPWIALILLTVSVLAFMAVQISLIRWVGSLQVKPLLSILIFVSSATAFLLFRKFKVDISVGNDILLMSALCMIGNLASYALREPNLLLPAALFSPLFDIWTVFWGPTHQIVKKAPKVVEAVSTSVPVPKGMLPFIPLVGPGDIAFLAIFFTVIYRFGMRDRLTYWLMVPFVGFSMLLVLAFFPYLPGLVPMGLAVVAANWKCFKLTRQEKISLGIVAIFVFGFVAIAAIK